MKGNNFPIAFKYGNEHIFVMGMKFIPNMQLDLNSEFSCDTNQNFSTDLIQQRNKYYVTMHPNVSLKIPIIIAWKKKKKPNHILWIIWFK